MTFKFASVALLSLALGFSSCSKNDEPAPSTPGLRAKMDYASLTATSRYTESFKNAEGVSTVDLGAAAHRLNMFTELNNYMALVAATTNPSTLDATRLRNLYTNTSAPFSAATLNTSGVQLRDKTAASFSEANASAVRTFMDTKLNELATASRRVDTVAVAGKAGRIGRYLVDGKGYEVNQVIQKALIGALLLDQIDNVLLSTSGLAANNSRVVDGKLYTELEHNWDMAYGYLTSKPIMTTVFDPNDRERFLAGYLNEKNSAASPAVYQAFLKGRAAIVNNDAAEVKTQAGIIRTELEKTIAKSAVSYLTNWKAASDPAVKAHGLAEGLGFIYSLRFCSKYGADAAWSDSVLSSVMPAGRGAWDLTNAHMDAAIAAINSKFSL